MDMRVRFRVIEFHEFLFLLLDGAGMGVGISGVRGWVLGMGKETAT